MIPQLMGAQHDGICCEKNPNRVSLPLNHCSTTWMLEGKSFCFCRDGVQIPFCGLLTVEVVGAVKRKCHVDFCRGDNEVRFGAR